MGFIIRQILKAKNLFISLGGVNEIHRGTRVIFCDKEYIVNTVGYKHCTISRGFEEEFVPIRMVKIVRTPSNYIGNAFYHYNEYCDAFLEKDVECVLGGTKLLSDSLGGRIK